MNLASLVTNESSLTPDDPCIGRVCDERLPLEGAAVSSAVGVAVLDVEDVALDLVHGGHLPHLDAARPLTVSQFRVHHLHNDEHISVVKRSGPFKGTDLVGLLQSSIALASLAAIIS